MPERSRYLERVLQLAAEKSGVGQVVFSGEEILLSATHAPKGGIEINGVFFPGGRFIPKEYLEKASPAEKEKLASAVSGRRKELRTAVGKPEPQGLVEKVKGHAKELEGKDLTYAKRAWASLKDFHGNLALHRLTQLVDADLKKLGKATDPEKKSFLERRLAAYNHMLGWAKEDKTYGTLYTKAMKATAGIEPTARKVADEVKPQHRGKDATLPAEVTESVRQPVTEQLPNAEANPTKEAEKEVAEVAKTVRQPVAEPSNAKHSSQDLLKAAGKAKFKIKVGDVSTLSTDVGEVQVSGPEFDDAYATYKHVKPYLEKAKKANKQSLIDSLTPELADARSKMKMAIYNALEEKYGAGKKAAKAPEPKAEAPKPAEPIKAKPAEPAPAKAGYDYVNHTTDAERQQMKEAAAKHPGMKALYSKGDVYHMTPEDAAAMAKAGHPVPEGGLPHKELEPALRKMLGKGHRVAILDQVGETPPAAKPAEPAPASSPAVPPSAPRAEALQRKTPSKGTPEREAVEQSWKEQDAEEDELRRKMMAAQQERDKSKYGSKKREQLDAKLEKVKAAYYDRAELNRQLQKDRHVHHLEDVVEHGDEAQKLAAQEKLRGKQSGASAYDRIKELAAAEAKKQGFTDQEDIDRVAMDAASMITSYPGNESLEQQVGISSRVHKRNTAKAAAEDAIGKMQMPTYLRDSYRRRVGEAGGPEEMKKLTDEARAEEAKHVQNEKKAAEQAKQDAATKSEESKYSSDLSSVKPSVMHTAGIVKAMRDRSTRFDWLRTAAETGFASDGRFAMKLPPDEHEKVKVSAVGSEGRVMSRKSLDDVLNSKKEGVAAGIVGVRNHPEADWDGSKYLLQSESGRQAEVDQKMIDTIRKRYPKATMYLPSSEHGPVIFKSGGEVVGAVMPFGGVKKNIASTKDGPAVAPPPAPEVGTPEEFFARANELVKKDKGEKKKIKLSTDAEVDAIVHGDLAYHKAGDGKNKWDIVHVPTGMRIMGAATKPEAAMKSFLLRHGDLDWSFTDASEAMKRKANKDRFYNVNVAFRNKNPMIPEGISLPGGEPSEDKGVTGAGAPATPEKPAKAPRKKKAAEAAPPPVSVSPASETPPVSETSAPAATPPLSQDNTASAPPPPTTEAFAKDINALASAAPGTRSTPDARGARFGDKVFIGHLYDEYAKKNPGVDRATFNRLLLDANMKGLASLSRADMVEAMHPEDVKASDVRHPAGATFNFVNPPTAPKATPPLSQDNAIVGQSPAAPPSPLPPPAAEVAPSAERATVPSLTQQVEPASEMARRRNDIMAKYDLRPEGWPTPTPPEVAKRLAQKSQEAHSSGDVRRAIDDLNSDAAYIDEDGNFREVTDEIRRRIGAGEDINGDDEPKKKGKRGRPKLDDAVRGKIMPYNDVVRKQFMRENEYEDEKTGKITKKQQIDLAKLFRHAYPDKQKSEGVRLSLVFPEKIPLWVIVSRQISRNGRVTLSYGAKELSMAEQEDLFDEEDIAGDGDSDNSAEEVVEETEETPESGGHAGMEDEAAITAEASKEAEELGIMVPPADSCDEWVKHFITAVKTHKSTKNLADESGKADAEEGAGDSEDDAMPEPQMVAMSARVQKLEADLAKREVSDLLADVKYIREVTPWALSDKEAKALAEKVSAKQLSLVDETKAAELADEKVAIRTMRRAADGYAKRAGLTTPSQLSTRGAEPVSAPEGSWGSSQEDDTEAQKKVLDDMMSVAGLK